MDTVEKLAVQSAIRTYGHLNQNLTAYESHVNGFIAGFK